MEFDKRAIPEDLAEFFEPAECGRCFVCAIVGVMREVWRVLRDDGTVWLNLGDSYCNAGSRNNGTGLDGNRRGGMADTGGDWESAKSTYGDPRRAWREIGIKHKDLCLIPERVAIALQSDGWYVRAKPPWIKFSPMPESTNDRPNVAHDTIWMLTKKHRYYFDMDAVRVPSAESTLERDKYSRIAAPGSKSHVPETGDHSGLHPQYSVQHDHETPSHEGGRHLRTNDFFRWSLDEAIEWHEAELAHLRRVRDKGGLLVSDGGEPLAFHVGAESFDGAHFAVWPSRLVRPMIRCGSSEKGACPGCGAPWRRVTEKPVAPESLRNRGNGSKMDFHSRQTGSGQKLQDWYDEHPPVTKGWKPSCSCNAGAPIPCTVLDPFGGAQTTVMAAISLGRRGIGLDLNRGYLEMGRRRIADSLRPRNPRLDPPPARAPLPGQMNFLD